MVKRRTPEQMAEDAEKIRLRKERKKAELEAVEAEKLGPRKLKTASFN